MIRDGEGVGELDAEIEAGLFCDSLNLRDEGYRVAVVEIIGEHLLGELEFVVPEGLVQRIPNTFDSQEGGVELDAGVQSPI